MQYWIVKLLTMTMIVSFALLTLSAQGPSTNMDDFVLKLTFPWGTKLNAKNGLGAQITLENHSGRVFRIEHNGGWRQWLDLKVVRPDGVSVTTGKLGDAFILDPLVTNVVLVDSGKSLTSSISLRSTLDEKKTFRGKYFVQAIYEFGNVVVRSEVIEVEIDP